jgi:hypothetical protein
MGGGLSGRGPLNSNDLSVPRLAVPGYPYAPKGLFKTPSIPDPAFVSCCISCYNALSAYVSVIQFGDLT